MKTRYFFLIWFTRIVLIGYFLFGAAFPLAAEDNIPRGVPTSTVEQLAGDIRKEGFQWKFLGRRIAFTATVETSGSNPKVVINGMDKGRFDTAALHNSRPDMNWKAGEKIKVSGMIVDQWYGVWQIWCYTIERVK